MPLTRKHASILAALAIAVGLASRRFPVGVSLWDKSLGDALYATMIFAFLALVRPAAGSLRLGVASFFVCAAIETFQLTGIPRTLPRVLRLALGTEFAWHDMACYAIGAAVTAFGAARWAQRAAAQQRKPVE